MQERTNRNDEYDRLKRPGRLKIESPSEQNKVEIFICPFIIKIEYGRIYKKLLQRL